VADLPTKASGDECTLEIIPDGRDLIAAVSLSPGTSFQLGGWTNELVELANTILAAESKWMPGELLSFAREVLASRRAKVLPLETDPSSLEGEITSEDELQQVIRARDAIQRFATVVRGILYEVSQRLEREIKGQGDRPETVQ
jgi:hypothetical protein